MNPTYQPAEVESGWYDRWEKAGVFRPEWRPGGEPFCVVIPPPNITGSLHMGHALNLTIHDVAVRRARMQGRAALWVPGTDHAGIATQNVVERSLAERGQSRHDIGREAFIDLVWEWKDRYGWRITEQIRRLGFSCDWTRERFTLDEGLSAAVRHVFVSLYEEGLVYRGNRIINWCPFCGTALAEIEVEYEETDGDLVFIDYPLTDGDGAITIATTRPETMLGDTGVAVHPDDERYQHLVGRTVTLPLVGRTIPIVADAEVDPGFGTGAVKVTPAHDPLDFDIGARHGLEAIRMMDLAGRVIVEPFAGLDRFEARTAVRTGLEEAGLVHEVRPHRHSVGHCYRSGTVVEPILSLQWFVKVRPLTEPAMAAVVDDRTQFLPERWEKDYLHWMENLRDWCVSRQIWWGHRIPAWYCECGEVVVARVDPDRCPRCGNTELTQDEDVLDTWFSSALWPFSTLGWPQSTADLAAYYPNTVLITAFDIIYFWVARMMQMGIHFMGDVPFRTTVIHGLVRDSAGFKMSKSKGNTIDPLDVVAEYGADALRLALLQSANPGQDVPIELEWVEGTRKFGNKLWNAARFVAGHIPPRSIPANGGYPDQPSVIDRWVIARLGEVIAAFDRSCDVYRYSDAFSTLYNFAWSEVFDWYLEMAKVTLAGPEGDSTRQTLGAVFRDLLKLFHPAIPYLTEELWAELVGDGLVAGSDWPVVPQVEPVTGMGAVQELVTAMRRFRAEHGLAPGRAIVAQIVDLEGALDGLSLELVGALARSNLFMVAEAPTRGHSRIGEGSITAFVDLEGLVDIDGERNRLRGAIEDAQLDLDRVNAKLDNQAFLAKAPAEVVDKQRTKQERLAGLIDGLRRQLESL